MMKKLVRYGMMAVAVGLALSGCSDRASVPSSVTSAKKVPFAVDKLSKDTVVLTVNGQNVTQGDYAHWLRAKELLYRLKNRLPVTGKIDGKAGEDFAKFRNTARVRMIGELVRRELTRQYAVSNKVTASAVLIGNSERQFAQVLGIPPEKLRAVLTKKCGNEDAGLIGELIAGDALSAACIRNFATNDLDRVTKEEAAERLRITHEYNARVDKNNAAQRERALAAKKEILGGKYFADVTERCADLFKEHGKKWETFVLSDFQADDPLALWLAQAKAGDISDPIDLDDGLAIVGLLRAYDVTPPGEEVSQRQYDTVRCTFYAYDKYNVTEDLDELAELMVQQRREIATQELGKALLDAAAIEFPLGEGIFRPGDRKKVRAAKKAARPGPFKENLKKSKKKRKAKVQL